MPTVTRLDGPPRLVIDLPDTVNKVRTPVGSQASDIRRVRINQFQQVPPVTRIVLDLAEPRSYAWEMVQNKLVVHLHPLTENTQKREDQPPPDPAFTQALEAAGSTSNVAGEVALILAGDRIAPGSSITAGEDTAILHLTRGGQVRVCSGTTISVTTSQNGRELMLGMSTGSIEAHYQIDDAADSILTPDFRILLSGPGEFHYAFSADAKGNTCVRALPGNASSAIVSELLGNGSYQVKPGEQVVFRAGQLGKADSDVPADCGCPTQREPILRAEADVPPALPGDSVPPDTPTNQVRNQRSFDHTEPAGLNELIPREESATSQTQGPPPTTAKAAQPHIFIQAPLVFRASDPPPAPVRDTRQLPSVSRRSTPETMALSVVAPEKSPTPARPSQPARQEKEVKGFFSNIRHLFSKIFG